jgi:hypothetical protein
MSTSVRTVYGFLNDQSINAMNLAQQNMTKTVKQVNTGKFADNYVDILERATIESYLGAKNLHGIYDTKITSNAMLRTKLGEMERVVRAVTEKVMPSVIKLNMEANNPNNVGVLDVVGLAKNHLAEIMGLLESSFNSQKLFGGGSVKASNVLGDIVNNSNVVAGVATSNYYLGDDFIFNEQISQTQSLEYGIRASDHGFPELIAGLHEIIAGNYSNATTFINQSQAYLGNMIADIGTNSDMVVKQLYQDEDAKLRIQEFVSNVEDADLTAVLTELINHEVQLKASFTLVNKISELSLVNYLK